RRRHRRGRFEGGRGFRLRQRTAEQGPMDALKPAVGWLLGGIVAIALGLAAKPLLAERIAYIASVMLVSIGVGSLAGGLIRWRLPALYEAAPAGLRRRHTRGSLLAMAAFMVMVLASLS